VRDRNSNYDGNVQKPESIERGNQAVLQAGGPMDDFSDIPKQTSAKRGGTPKNYFAGKRVTGGR